MKRWLRYELAVPIGLLSIVWISYFKYSFTSDLLLSILATCIVGFEVIKAIRRKTLSPDPTPLTSLDVIRRIVFTFAILLLFAFLVTSVVFGGRAISDDLASSSYEGYTTGSYYLATRNVLTEVTYGKWNLMRVFEIISIPLTIVSFLGNVLIIGFTKGWKFVFHPY